MAVVVLFWTHFRNEKGLSHSWLSAESFVDLNIDDLLVNVVWREVIKKMDDKPRQQHEHLLQDRHINGQVKESVFKEALEVVQRGLGIGAPPVEK